MVSRADAAGATALFAAPKGRPAICAFSANLSHRSPRLRRSAAISGELANLARRAHSAAWSLQYFAYDDITPTTRTNNPSRRFIREFEFSGAHMFHHEYLCRTATNQQNDRFPRKSPMDCCFAVTNPVAPGPFFAAAGA